MRKIAITGMAGFIGMHLGIKLKSLGYEVVGFDSFDPYYDLILKNARVQELLKHEIHCDTLDLCQKEEMEQWFQKQKVDATIHLAANAGVRYSIDHPHTFVESNLVGFVNLIEILKKWPEQPFIYASSSSVYGFGEKAPFKEEYPTSYTASLYGATKKCNEVIAYTYHHLYKMHTTGLRFFTVYGPWGRPDMAYWLFADAITQNEEIKIFNHGKMQRDFTYIDDIVNGIISSLEKANGYKIYNLGGSHTHELNEFVQTIEKHMGKRAKKRMMDMQPGDVVVTHADIHHAKHDLGFEPKVSLDQGIGEFVRWYKSWIKKNPSMDKVSRK